MRTTFYFLKTAASQKQVYPAIEFISCFLLRGASRLTSELSVLFDGG